MFPRTTLGLLAGLAPACGVAWRLGGVEGTGVVLGYLLGATLVAFGTLWQAHWLRVCAGRAFQAQLEGFLVKLGVLLVSALLFRHLSVLAEVADWQSFVIAYAGAVAVGLPLCAWESARSLRPRRDATGPLEQRRAG